MTFWRHIGHETAEEWTGQIGHRHDLALVLQTLRIHPPQNLWPQDVIRPILIGSRQTGQSSVATQAFSIFFSKTFFGNFPIKITDSLPLKGFCWYWHNAIKLGTIWLANYLFHWQLWDHLNKMRIISDYSQSNLYSHSHSEYIKETILIDHRYSI